MHILLLHPTLLRIFAMLGMAKCKTNYGTYKKNKIFPHTHPLLPPLYRTYRKIGVSDSEPCPLGTYGNTTGLRKITDCSDCDPGYYCDQRGLTTPADLCDPGYYCLDGSYTSAPNAPGSPLSIDDSGIGGLCPGGWDGA